MASNAQYILSQSFPNAGVTQLPRAPNLLAPTNGAGGTDQFDVGQYDSYSFQVYLAGSTINGTIYQGVSNNCASFTPYQSTPVTVSSGSQEVFFAVPANVSQYTKLYWSGSGAGQVTASVSLYGRGGRGR